MHSENGVFARAEHGRAMKAEQDMLNLKRDVN
jgi:hypothetical protein